MSTLELPSIPDNERWKLVETPTGPVLETYHTQRRKDIDATNCWLRGRFHSWNTARPRWGKHEWKECDNCNAKRMTAHAGCNVACWGGPG